MDHDAEDIRARLARAGRGRRWRRAGLWLALILAVAAGGLWLLRPEADTGPGYVTEAVQRGPLRVTVTATGTVQPTRQVDVSSELSGTLATVEADFNDIVTEGQVLARLDDAKLRAALANAEAAVAAAGARLLQAEATARETALEFEAQQELQRRGLVTQREFEARRAANDRAAAEVEVARANLTLAQANLTLHRTDLEKAVLRAPIDGVILNRTAEPGQIVASSLSAPTLFVIAGDLAQMELRVNVDEADIGRVAVGNVARFSVDAFPGRSFPARITAVRYAPETAEGVVSYKAILTVANDDLALRPGMTATASIIVAELADALMVPNAALRFAPPQLPAASEDEDQGGAGLLGLIMPRRPAGPVPLADPSVRRVFVLRGGEVAEVPVQTGETDGRLTEITQGDLTVGDAVIIDQRSGG